MSQPGVNVIGLNNSDAIELWRSEETTVDTGDEKGIIAGIFECCTQVLKELLAKSPKVKGTRFYRQSLESGMATLFFWGEEFDVPHGNLDRALQRSEEVRDLTLAVFISLADFLSNGKPPSARLCPLLICTYRTPSNCVAGPLRAQ
jgi:hypothetical protein